MAAGTPATLDVFLALVADHAFVENDVGIQNLARLGIGPRRPDRETAEVGDPAEGVVADVLRIELVVALLVADLDGVDEADLLEGLVPFQDPFPHVLAILARHGPLDPEDDRLFGRRFLRRRDSSFPGSNG